MSKRKTSPLWNFFSIVDNTNSVASCDICKQKLCYKSSVSNLKKHMQRKHPTVQIPTLETCTSQTRPSPTRQYESVEKMILTAPDEHHPTTSKSDTSNYQKVSENYNPKP